MIEEFYESYIALWKWKCKARAFYLYDSALCKNTTQTQ